MFEQLLVPLDGSELAEAALPAADALAKILDAGVTLVHVVEEDAPLEIHGQRHLSDPVEAEDYLAQVASRAFSVGTRLAWHVHSTEVRNVARSIASHADELGLGLIVMCTHGDGGMRDWLFGTIAQQVIAERKAPVLLIRPSVSDAAPPFTCQRFLVPLDGDRAHEQGLAVAAGLAEPCNAEIRLVCIVPTPATLSSERAAGARLTPLATAAALELDVVGARQYLNGQVEELEAQGLWAATEVRRGDPTSAIVQAAEEAQADMIILGTHGKAGMSAFWSESIAPRLSNRTPLPLLLVPVASTSDGE